MRWIQFHSTYSRPTGQKCKKTREEGSFSNKDTTDKKFEIMYRKRTQLNPVNKQEEVIDTIEVIDTDIVIQENALPSGSNETHQPSTSSAQIIQKKHSVEVSSSSEPRDREIDIKEIYKDIKAKNEEIKDEIYSQCLKKTPDNHNRLLSAFDYKTGKL